MSNHPVGPETEALAQALANAEKPAAHLPQKCCGNCHFGEFIPPEKKGDLPDFKVRECHFDPPLMFCQLIPGPKGMPIPVFNTGWPRVEADRWCGKWRAKEAK